MNFSKTILLLIHLVFLTHLNGQELTWMDKNKLAKIEYLFGLSVLDLVEGDIGIRTADYFGILDANNLKLKKKYKHGYVGYYIVHLDGKWYSIRQKIRLFSKNKPVKYFYTQLERESAEEKLLISIEPGIAGKKERKALKKEIKKQLRKQFSAENTFEATSLTVSKNRKWLMLPYFDLLGKKIRYIVFNQNLEKVYEKEIAYEQKIEGKEVNLMKAKCVLEDNGNITLTGFANHPENNTCNLYVVQLEQGQDQLSSYLSKSTQNVVFGEDKSLYTLTEKGSSDAYGKNLRIIHTDQQIIYAGLYKDEKGGGVFVGRFDRGKKMFAGLRETPFDESLLEKIKTNKKGKRKSKIKGEVILQDIVIKQNKEVSIFLEIDETQKDISSVSRLRGGGPIRGTNATDPINNVSEKVIDIRLDCKDIVYFNFTSENELKYSGVIKKHQKKGNPESASFICATKDNTTYVVFNTLDKKKSSIVSYAINNDGSEVTENIVIDAQKKLLIKPKRIDVLGNYRWRHNKHTGTSVFNTDNAGEILVEGTYKSRMTLIKIQF